VEAAHVLAAFGEDIDAMIASIDRALALNPSFARGWHQSGTPRLWAGHDIALQHFETSLRLSPRERVSLGSLWLSGLRLALAERVQ
jgi:predicted TPR repeat methyltransferase